jgi:Protein of unknown function (DUF2490)
MRRILSVLVLLGAFSGSALAENQIWTNYELKKKPTRNIPAELTLNAEVRFEPDADVSQIVLRPGIGYKVNDWLKVSGGYRYGQTLRSGPDQIEHRLWQQASYDLFSLGKTDFAGRTRLEQRFREGTDGTGWRARQQFSLEHPLTTSGLKLALSDEMIIGLNDTSWGSASDLQENRAKATVKWKAAGAGWEMGYLNQYRNGVNGADDETNHHIFLGVSKDF